VGVYAVTFATFQTVKGYTQDRMFRYLYKEGVFTQKIRMDEIA